MTTATTGTQQVYFEDVEEGQDIPGYDLVLTPTRVVLQVSGSQDWYEVHHDTDFARSSGHSDVFMNTRFTRSCIARMITDWVGPLGWMHRLRIEMRRMNRPGDTMMMRGKVLRKEQRNGKNVVELEVWIENDKEGKTTPSEATVYLPKRGDTKPVILQ